MRGGLFPYEYRIPVGDAEQFIAQRNIACHARHAPALQKLGPAVDIAQFTAALEQQNDADLTRLMLEYLPLAFSRRHGDPSRPWNRFSIQIKNHLGEDMLSYEGNWRDIFQNWEALLYSSPLFLPHVVAKFVNASTVDGHNAYRVSRAGVEWEEFDPDDPWSNIGYWGDHQIVYLLRLLEAWERFAPGAMARYFDNAIFVYAQVPYVLADYAAMIRNPHNTITYDHTLAQEIAQRVDEIGYDGRLLHAPALVRVGLMEKLLVPALAKLSAFVPGGGVWMNTQRPEWNDANNALAGYGLSMVTLCYLLRYIAFIRTLIARSDIDVVHISAVVAEWLVSVGAVLRQFAHLADDPTQLTDRTRRQFMDEMGAAATAYRTAARTAFDAAPVEMSMDTLTEWCTGALAHLNATIANARRSDGLFHSYSTISLPTADSAKVTPLPLMLEGQVAALSAGILPAASVVQMIDQLFASPLYRPDQNSFILYPFRIAPQFLERNVITAEHVQRHPVLRRRAQDLAAIIVPGHNGTFHFHHNMVNGRVLQDALRLLGIAPEEQEMLRALYEEIFQHHSYTGRSTSMYGYEGMGSIYWHMVGKLVLAVQESYWDARDAQAPPETVAHLADGYRRIRDGLGYRKPPPLFGAIPTDCYSHTPVHSGAQQPGMTGQVKEGILTRMGELGVRIINGAIHIVPDLLHSDELFPRAHEQSPHEQIARISVCGIPFELHRGATASIAVDHRDGTVTETPGCALRAEESAAIFQRSALIRKVRVTVERS